MYKDLYIAASGSIAAQKKMDTITNNLANINTPGFKADNLVFESYLNKSEREGAISAKSKPSGPVRPGEFVITSEQFTDKTQGALRTTGSPLDIALKGDGMLAVMTYEGERYTRAGNLSIGNDGALVTSDGHPVLDETDRIIYINAEYVNIDEDGAIWLTDSSTQIAQPELAGKLKIVEFLNPSSLTKEGNGLYRSNDPGEGILSRDTKVIQGSLESSNVNMIREMTEIIQNSRLNDVYSKIIRESDTMTSRAIANVGRP